jgi:hypothetical protein
MKYKYVTVYKIESIASSNLDADKVVYKNEEGGVTVTLTSDLNSHCKAIDTGVACAVLTMHGMLGKERIVELPEAIEAEVEKIQEERASGNSRTYAVILFEGEEEVAIDEKPSKDVGEIRICFDAVNKDSIREKHKEVIHAIVASLAICTNPEYHAAKITSGIYFVDENGKSLYSYSFKGGHARFVLAKPITTDTEKELGKIIGLSEGNEQLKTPFRLLTQSLEITQDNLRAFLSAWSSIEIFTNKVFSKYEAQFIEGIADEHNSHGVNQFLGRIKDVMKDKYRLTDKFSLIASFLSSEPAEDIELFRSMKEIRDTISHGKEFTEETLPVEDARRLSAKYLRGHMLESEALNK